MKKRIRRLLLLVLFVALPMAAQRRAVTHPPALTPDMPVAESPDAKQWGAAIAQDGRGAIITWLESTSSGPVKVRVAFLNEKGERSGDVLTLGGATLSPPAVAWDGIDSVVVWSDFSRILAVRIDGFGQLVDREPIVVGTGFQLTSTDIACGSGDCLVTWRSDDLIHQGVTYLRRLSAAGVLLDDRAAERGITTSARIAWNGFQYMVAYSSHYDAGCVIVRDGAVIGGLPMTRYDYDYVGLRGVIACNDLGCLIVNRSMSEFFQLDNAPAAHTFYDVDNAVWNGRHFVVAANDASCDLHAALFDRRGVLVARGIPIATTPGCELGAAMLALPDGRVIVVYVSDYVLRYRIFTDPR